MAQVWKANRRKCLYRLSKSTPRKVGFDDFHHRNVLNQERFRGT